MSDNSSNEPANRNKGLSTWKVVTVVVILVTATTLFFWLLILQCLSNPTFLKYTNLADSVFLTSQHKVNDPYTLYTVGKLAQSGMLMSLEDLWSFQSAFYQTIVTFLIAINGIIGALAFVFIKSSSNDKAQEAAIGHSKTYIGSADFAERVSHAVDERITGVQYDYQAALEELYKAKLTIEEKNMEIERLAREQTEIRRHLRIVSRAVSEADKTEQDGGDLMLESEKV